MPLGFSASTNGPREDGRGELVGDLVLWIGVGVELHTYAYALARTHARKFSRTQAHQHAHTCIDERACTHTRAHVCPLATIRTQERACAPSRRRSCSARSSRRFRPPLHSSTLRVPLGTPQVPAQYRRVPAQYRFRPPLRQSLRAGGSANARAPYVRSAAPQQRKLCLRPRCGRHARPREGACRPRPRARAAAGGL